MTLVKRLIAWWRPDTEPLPYWRDGQFHRLGYVPGWTQRLDPRNLTGKPPA